MKINLVEMSVAQIISNLNTELKAFDAHLIAVSKTYPPEKVLEAYHSGQRKFGENKVQELTSKYEVLPKDIEWHLIGHLQTNKVKYIAPFVSLIHSVDSIKLLREINKEAKKVNRTIPVLLQIYIADEETKFGLDFAEAEQLMTSTDFSSFENIQVVGFMGMATNTDNQEKIRNEFQSLKLFFEKCKSLNNTTNIQLKEVSMGMSGDYKLALEEGSTMVRIGSFIFGSRN